MSPTPPCSWRSWPALDQPPPAFAHLPLIADAAGRQFSKRLGALSLRSLREQGIEPLAIVADAGGARHRRRRADPARELDELVAGFSLAAYGRAAPKLVVDDLPRFSAAVLHHLPFADVAPRLRELGLGGIDAAFWAAIRGNLDRLEDAREWWEVCRRPLAPVVTEPELLAAAAEHLPQDLGAPASGWIEALKAATGRKGKALFHPLRLALTGREHGPELRHLLPLLGRERAGAPARQDGVTRPHPASSRTAVQLRLHNTLTRTKQVFEPIDPNRVRMYVCGPTVYQRIHVGNARAFVVFDVLYRLLRHLYGAETSSTSATSPTSRTRSSTRRARTARASRADRADHGRFHEDLAALGLPAADLRAARDRAHRRA